MYTRRGMLKLSGAGLSAVSSMVQAAGPPQSAAGPHDPITSARSVLTRILGSRAADIRLERAPEENGHPVYEFSADGGRLTIRGSSGVALARGFYAYLRETGYGMSTWGGRRIALPDRLPDLSHRRAVCPNLFVQYLNPCTFGYSAAFWPWERWERELDWMALHGVTMPLALDGQEVIWQKVWLSFGVTAAEWNHFTTGPAHLPWHRMGNINNFEGPLPQGWIDQKKDLQKQILTRMLELGMTPIVPAFAGHVPRAFLRIYPKLRCSTMLWGGEATAGFPRESRTFLLHPDERDLFVEVGRRFIVEYKREFQTGEYYLADSFNELTIPAAGATQIQEELKTYARNIYQAIHTADPQGKWVMQGWAFANNPRFWNLETAAAFLSAVPDDGLLIIDYASDMDEVHRFDYHDAPDSWRRLHGFFGKRWIAGMAHTFGGNNNVKGNLPLIAAKPFDISSDPRKGNLIGWGLDMEGIESNEVVYELMTDVGWAPEKIDLGRWIPSYCRARYGAYPPAIAEAWKLLLKSAYGSGTWKTKHAFQCHPSLNPKPQYVDAGPLFRRAVSLFVSCASDLRSSQLYRNDLIEFVAQAVGGAVDERLALACHEHTAGRADVRDAVAREAFELLARVDGLLHLRPDRRLETWVASARFWARGPDEAAYYDRNGRTLITVWGWKELQDYASRIYSGLIRDYYLRRWQVFFSSLSAGVEPALEEWELDWLSRPYSPSEPLPVPDLIAEVGALAKIAGALPPTRFITGG